MTSMTDATRKPERPVPTRLLDDLSRAYGERVDQLNEMRERLDRIRAILMPYLEDHEPAELDLDDLKRVLDLAEYGLTSRARTLGSDPPRSS